MRIADCELTHRHIRGHNVAFLFGPRGISDAEARELAEEWGQIYGPVRLPAYVSPDGWRSLYPVDGGGPIASLLRVDEDSEVIEFDGVKFSADLLRTFSTPTPDGFAFRIVDVDGIATIARVELPAAPAPDGSAAQAPAAAPGAAPAPASSEASSSAPAKAPTQPRKKKGEA